MTTTLAPVTADDLTTSTPDAAVPAPVVPTVAPDVLDLPVGYDSLRAAVIRLNLNARTDMAPDALRADIATLAGAMEKARPGVPVPPKNRGRYTGLRTYDFQNTLFHVNDRRTWHFTDRTLLLIWAVELCANKCPWADRADYVASTRTAYRNGKHLTNILNPTVFASTAYTLPTKKGAAKTAGK